ncbi:MAG: VanZ family protein [Oscillospiraceae bacterium]|nr:VanZ family protein [Ruminococcus sp.]MBP1566483.1 VanZ family protein [Oscillospiraceae bacterium]MBQ9981586.1 VanZ family protein [Oscillospiraceae bacterium]
MKKSNSVRSFLKFAFFIYLFAVLYITFLSREAEETRSNFELFNSYIMFFKYKNDFYLDMIVYNIIMTIPFGIFLPLLYKPFRSFRRVAFAGFLYSLLIEISQFISGRGLFELDDLFNNTIGAMLGYWLYILFNKVMIYILKDK